MNSATRLLGLYEHFTTHLNTEMGTVLGDYISVGGAYTREDCIAATQAIYREIKTVQTTLTRYGLNPILFDTPASQLRIYFDPIRYGVTWGSLKANGDENTRKALMWASYVLDKEQETDLTEEAIESIRATINAQAKLLHETEMPYALREILQRQIDELTSALSVYKISGIQPVVKVVNEQKGELLATSPEIVEELKKASPEAKNVFQKGYELVEKVSKVADAGSKSAKFIKDGIELTQIVIKLLAN